MSITPQLKNTFDPKLFYDLSKKKSDSRRGEEWKEPRRL